MAALVGFDEAAIAVLASSGSLMRGRKYAAGGVVTIDVASEHRAEARVRGSELYRVSLVSGSEAGGARRWSCNCMAAADGSFCKHCVAVALFVNDDERVRGEDTAVESFLASRSHQQLVTIIDEAAALDDRLRQRLEAMAMLNSGEAIDVKAWKKRVTKAFGRGFIDYRRAPEWAAGVREMLSAISDIGDAGHAEAAALLAEHAHKRTESATQRVDDSAGWITDIFHEIGVIHVAACNEGAFPPKRLAKRLVDLELSAELDTFLRSAVTHVDALGDKGLAEYGRLIDLAFDELPPNADRYGKAFRVRQARIAHAIAVRDPDRLIDVTEGELHSAQDYLEIIRELRRNARSTEAMEWADRGLRALAGVHHQLPAMRAIKAELMVEAGDGTAVDEMAWEAFEQLPTERVAGEYVQLASDPVRARERLIDFVGEHVATLTRAPLDPDGLGLAELGLDPRIGWDDTARRAMPYVEILLQAGAPQKAWDVARELGTSSMTWDRFITEHSLEPLDLVVLRVRAVERHIDRKSKAHYRRAAKVLGEIDSLAAAAGQPEIAVAIRNGVRHRHGNKPSLMKLI